MQYWAIAVIFQVISVLPFGTKTAFVTAYLFLTIPGPVKKCCVRFSNYFVFGFQTILCLPSLKEGSEWISSAACLFSPLQKRQEVHKCIHLKHFRVSGIKISNVLTKETSQISLQTLWHLRKPQINLVSL